jgi:hypothetical protein
MRGRAGAASTVGCPDEVRTGILQRGTELLFRFFAKRYREFLTGQPASLAAPTGHRIRAGECVRHQDRNDNILLPPTPREGRESLGNSRDLRNYIARTRPIDILFSIMWSRVFSAIFAFFAFLGFLRMPSLDTAILALPALMVIAIFLEDAWEYLHPPEFDPGPRCPQCDYDIRATPVRCPECGMILNQTQTC